MAPPLFSLPPPSVFRLFSFCSPLPLSCGCPLYVAPLPPLFSLCSPLPPVLWLSSLCCFPPPPHLSCRCPLYVASLCCPSCGCSLSVPPSLCLKCPVVLFLFPPPSVLSVRVFSLCFPLPLSCGCSLDVTLLRGRGVFSLCSPLPPVSSLSSLCVCCPPSLSYVAPPPSVFRLFSYVAPPPPLSLSLSLSPGCSHVAPLSVLQLFSLCCPLLLHLFCLCSPLSLS